ncbi:MAG: hypothetical protein II727_00410, partial [Oscillospiraceae bacterium]|nr:hypothetical protein [Oscillospiraceae bacterium]
YGAGLGKTAAQFVWRESDDGNVAPIGEMTNAFFARVAAQDASAFSAAFPGAQALGTIGEEAGFLTPVVSFGQVQSTLSALEKQGVKALSLIRKM